MLTTRICGSLAAAVAGDCIGSYFEGGRPIPISSVLETVQKFEKEWADKQKRETEGKKTKSCTIEFTDDTAMARSIASSLVQHNAVNLNDIAQRFALEFKKDRNRGYGGNVMKVLKELGDPNLQDIFGPARQQFEGNGSLGNGGAMRIAPLSVFYWNKALEELKMHTENISRITHTHPDAIVGAVLESYAIHLALSLDNSKQLDTTQFLQQLSGRLKPAEAEIYSRYDPARKGESDAHYSVSTTNADQPYCGKLEVIQDFLSRDDVSAEDVEKRLGTNISALGSVPAAIYCFLKGSQRNLSGIENRSAVEQTIVLALSLGGDTDTIATMAAAISGAFYGLEAVPECWQDCCEGVYQAIVWGKQIAELTGCQKETV